MRVRVRPNMAIFLSAAGAVLCVAHTQAERSELAPDGSEWQTLQGELCAAVNTEKPPGIASGLVGRSLLSLRHNSSESPREIGGDPR